MRRNVIVVTVCLFLLGIYLLFFSLSFMPLSSREHRTVIIAPKSPFRVVAEQLSAAGIVESALGLRLLAKLTAAEQKIQSGEYEFAVPDHPYRVLRLLVEGKVKLHKITIPEG